MSRRASASFLTLSVALLLTAGGALAAAGGANDDVVPPGGGRLLVEGGWAVPLGNLAEGLYESPTGAGARPGFELGMRWRFALAPGWTVAPSFHYLGYGDATGLGAKGDESLSTASLRYGVELLLKSTRDGVRPFIGLTPCVVHNLMTGTGKDQVTQIDASGNTLGLSASAGLQFGGIEVSAVYHVNRFNSYSFFWSGYEQSYNWDTFVLRFAWYLP
jgi:hypothetical protein